MKKAMIVVIDMQNGFMDELTEGLDERQLSFLQNISPEVPVIGTCYVNHEHTPCYVFEGWKDCMEGSRDAEILDSLKPVLSEVFKKDKYSCWNDEFKAFVEKSGAEKLYFFGVNTDCCVLHSAFDCYNDLVDCAVIADLCASTAGRDVHEAALTVLRSCITNERVITADEALKEIQKDAWMR